MTGDERLQEGDGWLNVTFYKTCLAGESWRQRNDGFPRQLLHRIGKLGVQQDQATGDDFLRCVLKLPVDCSSRVLGCEIVQGPVTVCFEQRHRQDGDHLRPERAGDGLENGNGPLLVRSGKSNWIGLT